MDIGLQGAYFKLIVVRPLLFCYYFWVEVAGVQLISFCTPCAC